MTVRIRELATGVASCVLLLPAGCRRPSAELSVDPESGGEPVGSGPAADADCEDGGKGRRRAKAQPVPGASGDREAPVVLGGRFVARDRLQLSFSEPLAPVEHVNPRQFRLSMAYSNVDYGDAGYASGYYYDLAGPDNYEPPVVVTALERYDERPEILALQLSRPVPAELCVDLEDMRGEAGAGEEGFNAKMGVFLHYTHRGSEGVRDLAQNRLDDIGAHWALHFGARHQSVYGAEPVMRLDLLVELDCPAETLGVSAPPGPS